LEKNLGFSEGHNHLFSLTESEYVLCLNQDAVLAYDYIERVVAFLDAAPGAGSASGLLVRGDGQVDSAGLIKNWYEKIYDLTELPTLPIVQVFGVSGAAAVYRRCAVLDVSTDGKLFDRNFFAYKEDTDLAWRLHSFGWKSYLVSAARAVHQRGFGSEKKWRPEHYFRQKLSSRNHLLVLVKNLPTRCFWRLPFLAFYELGKFCYLAVFVPKSLGYVKEFLNLLPDTLKARKIIADKLKIRRKSQCLM